MRGEDAGQVAVFSYVSPEQRVPKDHPLRPLLRIVNDVLGRMSPLFEELYSHTGRPSIPPEKLLRALLLQVLYTIRSERMLMEQLDYNLLFRWFVGLNMGRSRVGCDGVHEEPRSSVGRRGRRGVLPGSAGGGTAPRSAIG